MCEVNYKVIITKQKNRILYGYYGDGVPVELYAAPVEDDQTTRDKHLLGNIYAARVDKVAEGIGGAFLETEHGKCYFPLKGNEHVVKLSPGHEDKLYGGDVILVQIAKDAVKTKLPVADGNISLKSRYFVLTLGDKRYSVSKKIHDAETRLALEKLIKEYRDEGYGIIARTNAAEEDLEVLESELKQLKADYDNLMRKAGFALPKTCLYKEPPHYITFARELPKNSLSEIVVDDEEIYQQLKDYYEVSSGERVIPIRLYTDSYSLYLLYRMAHHYEEATGRYVYLKSGGSLVIEQTEAMVVIDVNTGAVIHKKQKSEDVYYETNREAAAEIARQVRLRNLSGMIVIDFINMKKPGQDKKIMDLLAAHCGQDRIRCRVVDMTGLGLVEMTRSKNLRPLLEQWRGVREEHVDE